MAALEIWTLGALTDLLVCACWAKGRGMPKLRGQRVMGEMKASREILDHLSTLSGLLLRCPLCDAGSALPWAPHPWATPHPCGALHPLVPPHTSWHVSPSQHLNPS